MLNTCKLSETYIPPIDDPVFEIFKDGTFSIVSEDPLTISIPPLVLMVNESDIKRV